MTSPAAPSPSAPAGAAPRALDLPALQRWLAPRLEGTDGTLEGSRIEGGQSNPTWVLRGAQGAWVLRAKPAPTHTLLPSAHAIEREYRVLHALQDSAVPVPRVHALCEDESVIGVAFYVMDHVPGRVLRDVTLQQQPAPARAGYYQAMGQTLVALHQVDWRRAGLQGFGRPDGYFSRLIRRWTQQYRASADTPIPAMEALARWLPEHIPPGADGAEETCITHGDFRLENLLFDPEGARVAAVLDWELSTLGHPLGDLAYNCLTWHLGAGLLRGLDGLDLAALHLPGQQDHVLRYCRATGRDMDRVAADWPFHLAFNLFRLGAILQGVAQRQRQGQASSSTALEIGRMAGPVAERGWALACGAVPAL